MAARVTHRYGEKWRSAIQVGMIRDRLEKHVLGECEMSATQVRAAEILLKKVMPDLSAVQVDGDGEGGPIQQALEVRFVEQG
jgi:hypothetical protein